VTAGIDFGLQVVGIIKGFERAQQIQLFIEYCYLPGDKRLHQGPPQEAQPEVLTQVRQNAKGMLDRRTQATLRAAANLREREGQS